MIVIAVIIVLLGTALFFMRDKLGMRKEVAPAEKVLQEGNKAVENTAPTTVKKVQKELGADQNAEKGEKKTTEKKSE